MIELFYALPIYDKPERLHLYKWIEQEEEYVENKFDDQRNGHDESTASYDIDDFWSRQIIQYIDRARQFMKAAKDAGPVEQEELEMRAQQAMAKCMMTAKGCVESMIRVYGPLPAPGVSSGEIKDWQPVQ